jgi:PiT family inorganic phosphate transporter
MDAGAGFHIGLGVVVALVLVALAFDFMNGFHDAANSIATVVSTRVLKPYQAVLLAAFFNFLAVFIFHLSVAATVGRGIIDQGIVDHYVVFGALIGAISWNIITWHYGIPSSSSHALIGGLVGAAVAKAGTWALIPAGILKTVAFIFISPLLGFVIGSLLMLAISWLFVRQTPSRVDRLFRRLQLVSSSMYSLGHGGNDAQKTIGIIWMLLIAAGHVGLKDPVPNCSAAGASSRRWDSASPRCGRSAASAPSFPGRSPCSSPRASASRCPPRIPSPARSSASARRRRCRRCAGASPATSSGPGC